MGTISDDCVNGHTVVSKAHHLDDAPTCVKFFSEILRDGGKLVALVPFQSSQANTFARLVMQNNNHPRSGSIEQKICQC